MKKELIVEMLEHAFDSHESIDDVIFEFYQLLDEAYKIKDNSILSCISEDALKIIDKEIKK